MHIQQDCPAPRLPACRNLCVAMTHASGGIPDDVLVVEDDAIIALDFEDTIIGFGVRTVRTAASVARAPDDR